MDRQRLIAVLRDIGCLDIFIQDVSETAISDGLQLERSVTGQFQAVIAATPVQPEQSKAFRREERQSREAASGKFR